MQYLRWAVMAFALGGCAGQASTQAQSGSGAALSDDSEDDQTISDENGGGGGAPSCSEGGAYGNVQSGAWVSLETIIDSIQRSYGGRFLDARVENRGGTCVYIVIWDQQGRRIDFTVDPADGSIIGVNE